MLKYDPVDGKAKIDFLALSQKSKNKLINAYFKDETNNVKMDNLIQRLKKNQILKY